MIDSRALVGVGVVRFRATVLVSLLLLRPPGGNRARFYRRR